MASVSLETLTLEPDGAAIGCGRRPQVGPIEVGSTPGADRHGCRIGRASLCKKTI